jgi:ssDNA-binding Zn-finger/Zn-ribbon topoisomerase 1
MKLMFNACPKCSGDMELRRDIYGIFVSCFQCGLQRDLDAPMPTVQTPPKSATKTVAARERELLKAA